MKTAEEIYRQITGCTINHGDIKTAMIEFAKIHVEQALIEASKKARQIEDPYAYTGNTGSEYPADYIIDKDSIINAYPLEKIM